MNAKINLSQAIVMGEKWKVGVWIFSPTRSGLLASVVEGGKNIRLHDIQSWAVMTEDGDPAVIEREVKCSNLQNTENQALPMTLGSEVAQQSISTNPEHDTISGFAWHPKQESVLVCVMNSGRLAKCAGNRWIIHHSRSLHSREFTWELFRSTDYSVLQQNLSIF